MDCDRVVLDETAWRAEDNDATVGRVRDDIVSDDAVGTTEADTVSPLLESIRAARADIVVLDDDARAGEWTFGDMKTRPRAGVVRVNVFDLTTTWLNLINNSFEEETHQLRRVVASHLNVSTSLGG